MAQCLLYNPLKATSFTCNKLNFTNKSSSYEKAPRFGASIRASSEESSSEGTSLSKKSLFDNSLGLATLSLAPLLLDTEVNLFSVVVLEQLPDCFRVLYFCQIANAVDGAFGPLEGRIAAFVHPAVMGGLFLLTLYAGYLGWQWRRVRTIGDEISALKKQLPAPVEGAPPSPLEAEITKLTEV